MLSLGCSGAATPPAADGGSKAGGGSSSSGGGHASGGGSRPDGSGGIGQGGEGSTENSCGLAGAAFCEDFEDPKPGGRAGDLDESRWHFGRWGHTTTSMFLRQPSETLTMRSGGPVKYQSTFCGEEFSGINMPDDVRYCDGVGPFGNTSKQLNEVFDDQGDFGYNSMRITQPFDFTGRTGAVVWEVDAKINPDNIGHGWWFEIWVTEDPGPMPYHNAPTVIGNPKRGVGFAFQFAKRCQQSPTNWMNALETVHIIDDYHPTRVLQGFDLASTTCFKVADAKLNRFRLEISKDKAVLRASDYDGTEFTYSETVEDMNLPFERGYVHFQHAQYNAHKDGDASPVQTFRWDNIGFDGPALPVPRSYQAADNTQSKEDGIYFGYDLTGGKTAKLDWNDVSLEGAERARFNFNLHSSAGSRFHYRFNGGGWHDFTVPQAGDENGQVSSVLFRTFSLEAPLSELVEGKNTVEVSLDGAEFTEGITNLELFLETGE